MSSSTPEPDIERPPDGMASTERQLKNGIAYLLPVTIGYLLPIISLPIFTRILTKEEFGVLALAQIYGTFAGGLANFGMGLAYERNYFQYRDSREKTAQLLYSILAFVTVNFILVGSLTYLFRDGLADLITGSPANGNILFWVSCATFVTGMSYYYLAYFKNSENAKLYIYTSIAIAVLNLAVSMFLVVYLRTGVIGIVYAQVASGGLIFIILSGRFLTSFSPSLNRSMLIEALKIGYPLTPRLLFGVVGTRADRYFIGLLASVAGVGIYSIGQRLAYTVFAYMSALENVFSPQVYRRYFDMGAAGGAAIGKYITPFAYLSISFALLLALFSEEVIFILTPTSYHGAINIVIILAIFYGFQFFGKITGNQLIFMKKTHITSLLTIVSIGINVGLNIPFILMWGAVGAAWATLAAGMTSLVIWFVIAQHYYTIKWEYGKIASIFLTFLASAVLIFVLRDADVSYEVRLLVKVALLSVYAYIGVKIGVLTFENISMVRNAFRLSGLPGLGKRTA